MSNKAKGTIGRTIHVDFPELGLKDVLAKIDTGSYRGALHCKEIMLIEKDRKTYLSFAPLDDSHRGFSHVPVLVSDFSTTRVKNTSGSHEPRYVIKTTIILNGVPYPIELTLSDRANMRSPVLIGRKFLKGKFVVDVTS